MVLFVGPGHTTLPFWRFFATCIGFALNDGTKRAADRCQEISLLFGSTCDTGCLRICCQLQLNHHGPTSTCLASCIMRSQWVTSWAVYQIWVPFVQRTSYQRLPLVCEMWSASCHQKVEFLGIFDSRWMQHEIFPATKSSILGVKNFEWEYLAWNFWFVFVVSLAFLRSSAFRCCRCSVESWTLQTTSRNSSQFFGCKCFIVKLTLALSLSLCQKASFCHFPIFFFPSFLRSVFLC